MNHRKIISILAVGALALVAVLGAFTYQTVSAQDTTPTTEPETQTTPQASDEIKRGSRIRLGGVSQEALAQALGIDIETLEVAQETAASQALEQAVSAGLITQDQADRLAERGFMGKFRMGRGMLSNNDIDYDALLAQALNISVEELQAARQEAFITVVDEAVTSGEITLEQGDLLKGRSTLAANDKFQSSMQAAFETAVQQAVADGVITQAQADLILAEQAERGGYFNHQGFGHGFGRHGRGGGMRPGIDEVPAVEP